MPPAVWASAVLVAGLLFTAWVAHREWRDEHRRTQAAYAALADGSALRLQAPLQDAAATLRAMQTVFLANDRMDQAQVRPVQREPALARPACPVMSPPSSPAASPIRTIPGASAYPSTNWLRRLLGNESLIGFDIASQKQNLLALQRARDADPPPFPNRSRCVSSVGRRQAAAWAVTVRLPVYSRGPIPDSIEAGARREIGALAISLRLERWSATPCPRQALEPLPGSDPRPGRGSGR